MSRWAFEDSIREAREQRIPESLHAAFRNEPIVHHALSLYVHGTVELEEALALAIASLVECLEKTREMALGGLDAQYIRGGRVAKELNP